MFSANRPLLALLPVFAGVVHAQAPSGGPGVPMDPAQWPEWITNDYECVIKCLSGFNDQVTTIPQSDLEKEAFSCSSANCEGDGTGNYYQTLYYIQLFYATGSIYEWADSAPDGYKHATFNDGSSQAQESASDVIATASEPWSASGLGDSQPPPTDAATSSAGIAQSPGATATDSASHTPSPAKSASGSGSASASASASKSGSGNGTEGGNGSSGALPAAFIGLGPSVQGALGIALGTVVAGIGGVWIGQ